MGKMFAGIFKCLFLMNFILIGGESSGVPFSDVQRTAGPAVG
jgi:hypothetical protein